MADSDSKEPTVETAPPPANRGGGDRPFFTWRYKYGVDSQGRIQFPSKWRPRVGDWNLVAVKTRHEVLDKDFVQVVTQDHFDSQTTPLRGGRFGDSKLIAERHEYVDRVLGLEFDKAGRFTLPPEFLKDTGLPEAKEALLVGCQDRFEIWCVADWDTVRGTDRVILKADPATTL
jgi:DNA-binding transcriptional regulator/RsmH inhibitor MraZ